jgi:hypothetical protein
MRYQAGGCRMGPLLSGGMMHVVVCWCGWPTWPCVTAWAGPTMQRAAASNHLLYCHLLPRIPAAVLCAGQQPGGCVLFVWVPWGAAALGISHGLLCQLVCGRMPLLLAGADWNNRQCWRAAAARAPACKPRSAASMRMHAALAAQLHGACGC